MPTLRDMSGVRVPGNLRWSDTELDECRFCGQLTPRPYVYMLGQWVRFIPYPCDCEENRRWVGRGEVSHRKTYSPPARFTVGFDEQIAGWIADKAKDGIGSYLVGSVGVGKTATAHRALEIASRRGMTVEATSASKMRSEISDARWSQTEAYASLTNVRLLMIDDLGNADLNDFSLSVLIRVVNDRYERKLPVVVTSNYALPDLAQRIAKIAGAVSAQALVSRLAEMTERIEMAGADRRLHG